jgi:excisionase family DNA binding protein
VTEKKYSQAEELLTPAEAAKVLRVSSGWVRDHATRREPRLPAVRIGKLIRFRRADLEEFIAKCCQPE